MHAIESAGGTLSGMGIWWKNVAEDPYDPETMFAPVHDRIYHAAKGSPIVFENVWDVFRVPVVEDKVHPAQKPVDLLAQLINALTVEGELVADPFAGVASTLVAAKQTNRAYWGCEIDAQYFAEGVRRLS
jgi:DNA modification methylase